MFLYLLEPVQFTPTIATMAEVEEVHELAEKHASAIQYLETATGEDLKSSDATVDAATRGPDL